MNKDKDIFSSTSFLSLLSEIELVPFNGKYYLEPGEKPPVTEREEGRQQDEQIVDLMWQVFHF